MKKQIKEIITENKKDLDIIALPKNQSAILMNYINSVDTIAKLPHRELLTDIAICYVKDIGIFVYNHEIGWLNLLNNSFITE